MTEDIRRLTYRTNYVIHFIGLARAEILNAMVSVIQRRADEVVHSGINNHKLLASAMFHISDTCYKSSALGNNAATKLKMYMLAGIEFQIVGVCRKIEFKIGDRIFVGGIVTDTQAAAYIDVRQHQATCLKKQLLEFVYSAAQGNEIVHHQNL